MNAERRPAGGKPDKSDPSTDETGAGAPVPTGDQDVEAPGAAAGPGAQGAESPAAPDGGPDDGAGGSGPGAEASGEGPEASGEREDSAGPDESVESLRARLDDLRGELGTEREAALRARAETENVRRRAARDVEQAHRFGIEGLVGELLPIRDGLELGIQAAKEGGGTVEALAEGTEMTLRMLTAALEKFGAVEVNPEGEDFDPQYHQAMSMQEAEGVESGKVIQVFQKGCLLHGRVVRPAMVIVSR